MRIAVYEDDFYVSHGIVLGGKLDKNLDDIAYFLKQNSEETIIVGKQFIIVKYILNLKNFSKLTEIIQLNNKKDYQI